MAVTHYYFAEQGTKLHEHIKTHNISISLIADKLTNTILVNCLNSSTPEARASALKAFKDIKDSYDYSELFPSTIFPDYTRLLSDDDLNKLAYDESIANKSYEMGIKFRSTA